MLNLATEVGAAAARAALGADRLRSLGTAAAAGRAASTQLLTGAVALDLEAATAALRRAREAAGSLAPGLLPPDMASQLGRGLRALAVAEAGIGHGLEQARRAGEIGQQAAAVLRPLAGEFGRTLEGLGQRTVRLLDGTASALRDGYAAITDRLSGRQTLLPVVPSLAAPQFPTPPAAIASHPHLMILSSRDGQHFYFGLGTAAYDTLKRSTRYGVATQERLQREEAAQAVHQGGETLSVSGAIFTKTRAGARQLDTLRGIGRRQQPLLLTTGYGESLGHWLMLRIDEEQSGLMPDGAPRKQTFSLEFQRYGDDYAHG